MEATVFTEDQEVLSKEAWRLMLNQKDEMQEYRDLQEEILREIFE